MEFMTGKTEKKTVLISDILSGEYEGKEVLLNGGYCGNTSRWRWSGLRR